MVTASTKTREKSGGKLRAAVPRSSHADWTPAPDRRSPVALLTEQDASRLPWLVPYRHQRMTESPFAFFRGSARIMAADLAGTPVSGLNAQICGDAHLANFGLFASPERDLVFDLNDFDETLVGPWEWDVKRLATSFIIASRHNGFTDEDATMTARSAVQYYRDTMRQLASLPAIEVWYWSLRAEDIAPYMSQELNLTRAAAKKMQKRQRKLFEKARSRDSHQALNKLTTQENGSYQFVSDPPFIVPLSELRPDVHPDQMRAVVETAVEGYRQSLSDSRRALLDHYELTHVALKVVGVGSVGTRCFVLLLQDRGVGDPLILQLKEAGPSALAEFLEPSPYEHQGQRVVEGQHFMQSASDIFLGWTTVENDAGQIMEYYVRQLKDMKLSAPMETYVPPQMDGYARLCGLTLAHAHARTADIAAIAGYMGKGNVLIDALVTFANAYADQNDLDYQEFLAASEAEKITSNDASEIAV